MSEELPPLPPQLDWMSPDVVDWVKHWGAVAVKKREKALLAEIERLKVALAGAEQRGSMMLDAKNAMRERAEAAERELAEVREQLKARSQSDPVTRLHNLCDALQEQAQDSPYDQKSWELADEDNRKLRVERDALRAQLEAAQKELQQWREFCTHHGLGRDEILAYFDAGRAEKPSNLDGKLGFWPIERLK